MKKIILHTLNITGLLLTLFGFFRLALLLLNDWFLLSLMGIIHTAIFIVGLLIFFYSKKHLNFIGGKTLISGIIVTIIFIIIFSMYYAPIGYIYSLFK